MDRLDIEAEGPIPKSPDSWDPATSDQRDQVGPADRARLGQSSEERLAFLQWRLEQTELGRLALFNQLQGLTRELAEVTSDRSAQAERAATLDVALAEARRQQAHVAEQLSYSEHARARIDQEDQRSNEPLHQQIGRLERERNNQARRAEEAVRRLARTRERLDHLERAQARFFDRLLAWQRDSELGHPVDVDLAQFISELRAEISLLGQDQKERAFLDLDLGREDAVAPTKAPDQQTDIDALRPIVEPETVDALGLSAAARRAAVDVERTRGERQLSAARSLVAHAGVAAVPYLARAAGRVVEPDLRVQWLRLLAETGPGPAEASLRRGLDAGDPRVRAEALSLLVRLAQNEDEAQSIIEQGLGDDAAQVRRRAAMAWAQKPNGADLQRLLDDPDPSVRRIATAALPRGATRATQLSKRPVAPDGRKES